MLLNSVRFVSLEVSVLDFGIISRSICKCFSKKALPLGLLDSKESKTAQLTRAGLFYFWHIPRSPPLENISHLSVSSLWVCAWSWSPGMEAPYVGRRLLHIPFFHQQIHRVSLFLIDFRPLFFLSLIPSPSICLFCLPLLFPSTDCKCLQPNISQLCASQAVSFPCWIKERVKAPHIFLLP